MESGLPSRHPIRVITESEIPRAVNPLLQHAIETYASEINKTSPVARQFRTEDFPFRPHPRSSAALEIFRHQLLSERRFFGEFLGSSEPDPSRASVRRNSGSVCRAVGRTGAAEARVSCEAGRRMVDLNSIVLRCGAATNLDILETGAAFGPPPDTVDRLSAAARQARGFELRTDCGCDLDGRRSYTRVR
jgi:hypothetical protein